jgi:hypothetical protein
MSFMIGFAIFKILEIALSLCALFISMVISGYCSPVLLIGGIICLIIKSAKQRDRRNINNHPQDFVDLTKAHSMESKNNRVKIAEKAQIRAIKNYAKAVNKNTKEIEKLRKTIDFEKTNDFFETMEELDYYN